MKDDIMECVIRAIEARIHESDEMLLKDAAGMCSQTVAKRRTGFHSVDVPNISIRDFYDRLAKYCGASHECYVITCIYLDRLADSGAGPVMDTRSAHRLFAVALFLAAKARDDTIYSNAYYSKVAGISLASLASLEQTMLLALDFQLYVSQAQYGFYENSLMQRDYGGVTSKRIIGPCFVPASCVGGHGLQCHCEHDMLSDN
eukprot:TRINITY_DN1440_c2_g1_i2.p2 TRINITY_DN1440_c2_g1~~TRINITY_DN1440_c2_g1_i2.p2  ORF type:complete len:202 (+),score=83.31 TRINITY_DN1440_c2_g1_i2:1181-1786(+)